LLSSRRERHKGYPYILIKLLENVPSLSLRRGAHARRLHMCVFTCHKLCARCLSRASRHSECNKNIVMSQSTEGKLRGSRSFIFHYFYLRFAGVFAYLSLLPPHCVCRWWPKLFLSNFRQESRECAHRAAPEVGINYLP
jgi:hypothetical protein